MIIKELKKKGLISPPRFLSDNTHYLCCTGSSAYGCSENNSDIDVYGFCIPPKNIIFPHMDGYIKGFGVQPTTFDVWQEHHIKDIGAKKQYDFSVYSIIKFFQLCMDNNPNMLDSLFVPQNCIIHCTQLANTVRENRRIFLHKGCWAKFKGYAYSQLHKMDIKNPEVGSKRYETINKYGYDLKFAYHVIRLLDEVEQILTTGDLNLQRAKEILKSIRRGEWSEEKMKNYFDEKEATLEDIYRKSELPLKPNEQKIKDLLLECLEMHFGSLTTAIPKFTGYEVALRKIQEVANAYLTE